VKLDTELKLLFLRELNNEKVDIISWSDDPEEFLHEALKPAIGRRGQNARLTSRLMGWDVQVSKDESQHEQFEARVSDGASLIAELTGLDDEKADKIFRAGGTTAGMVLDMGAEYIAGIAELSSEEAEAAIEKIKENQAEA